MVVGGPLAGTLCWICWARVCTGAWFWAWQMGVLAMYRGPQRTGAPLWGRATREGSRKASRGARNRELGTRIGGGRWEPELHPLEGPALAWWARPCPNPATLTWTRRVPHTTGVPQGYPPTVTRANQGAAARLLVRGRGSGPRVVQSVACTRPLCMLLTPTPTHQDRVVHCDGGTRAIGGGL